MLCDLNTLKNALGIPLDDTSKDAALNNAIATANAMIGSYIGADLSDTTTERVFEVVLQHTANFIQLPVYPLIAITEVKIGSAVLDVTTYVPRRPQGEIDLLNMPYSGDVFGARTVVKYTAGYDPVPDDLELACVNIAATVYNNGGTFASSGGSGALKSLTMFDAMSMSFDVGAASAAGSTSTPEGLTKSWAFVLDKYRVYVPVLE